jgi:hypothetical protein
MKYTKDLKEALKDAKIRYPEGSRFKCVNNNKQKFITVKHDNFSISTSHIYPRGTWGIYQHDTSCWLYLKGVWATSDKIELNYEIY